MAESRANMKSSTQDGVLIDNAKESVADTGSDEVTEDTNEGKSGSILLNEVTMQHDIPQEHKSFQVSIIVYETELYLFFCCCLPWSQLA